MNPWPPQHGTLLNRSIKGSNARDALLAGLNASMSQTFRIFIFPKELF